MNYLLVGASDLCNRASADLFGDLVEGLNLGIGLDLVEWVTVGRVADTIAINGECAIASIDGYVDIGVVVVFVGQVPVSDQVRGEPIDILQRHLPLVETYAVTQDLYNAIATGVRSTVLCGDLNALF